MAKVAGCLWIETTYFHYIASDASEWRIEGTYISTPSGAVPGSIWIDDGNQKVHYIDANGDERELDHGSIVHTDGAATIGSFWIEGDFGHFIDDQGDERQVHQDFTHSDIPHSNHTDNSHDDVTHSDTPHDDHTDNSHNDTSHSNTHSDGYGDHSDGVHFDGHFDTHTDTPHSNHTDNSHDDVTHSDTPHSNHTDNSHNDTNHTDVDHGDQPEEIGV